MKRLALALAVVLLAALACSTTPATPTFDIHSIETIAAGTTTASAPTQTPQPTITLIPVPTLAPLPSATPFPTLPPAAPGPERIQFAPGAVAGSVTGTTTFPNRKQYVLYAFKGQRMTVQIASASNAANFSITGVSDGQPLKRIENEDRTWIGLLPATQDYLLTVAVPGGSVTYTLTVTIVWP